MSRLVVEDYQISRKTGFLLEDPLMRLPPYFDPWNDLARDMTKHLKTKTMRDEVMKLPILDHTRLSGHKEVKLAHLELAVMTVGYLYQDGMDPENIPKVLPSCLALPLYGLYETHGYIPVISYMDVVLNNWRLKDPNGPVEIENLQSVIDFPGDEEWAWFFAVAVMTEYVFGPAIQAIQDVMDGVDHDDELKITRALEVIAESVSNMQTTLVRVHEKMSAEGFFGRISTFFVGWSDGTPLANGLIYEGVQEDPIKMMSANASQTPVFHVLDALLGITHPKARHDYTNSKCPHLVPSHAKFIEDVRKRPTPIKHIVESSTNPELKEAYRNLVKAMTDFRSYHVQIVAKYVLVGMKKCVPEEQYEELQGQRKDIMNYIKAMRDDCKS